MNEANNYRRRGGNIMFHIALKPDGTLQPSIHTLLTLYDCELMDLLLQPDCPGGETLDLPDGTGYLFTYDYTKTKPPYPDVMIWKYRKQGTARVIIDVEKKDMSIIPYAVDTYLR